MRAKALSFGLLVTACAGSTSRAPEPAAVVVPSAEAEEAPTPTDAGLSREELRPGAEVPAGLRSCKPDSSPAEREEAKILFKEGVTAFELGDYRKAAEQFLLAYQKSCAAPLLFNLATALERLGETGEAIGTLELYLELNPSGSMVEEVRRRLEKLRARP